MTEIRLRAFSVFLVIAALFGPPAFSDDREINDFIMESLSRPAMDPRLPRRELENVTRPRIAPLREVTTEEAWKETAAALREEILNTVVLAGAAREWRNEPLSVEWAEVFVDEERGYRIRKLRYEGISGLWIPALLYEPLKLQKRAPAVLNLVGHDEVGKAAEYIQILALNQVARGMVALCPDWVGMGELSSSGFYHFRANQLDLLGTPGVSVHFLALLKAVDLLSDHYNVDPQRIAVTGHSGGGWQSLLLAALDERVLASNPVAGFSNFGTRLDFPLDLADSEQLPARMAELLDYSELTRLMAPRHLLLSYSTRDNCCFAAEHAALPIVSAVAPVYSLLGADDRFEVFVSSEDTHHFSQHHRERSYRFLMEVFGLKGSAKEIDVSRHLRSAEELLVSLPEENLDFNSIASRLIHLGPSDVRLLCDPGKKEWRARRRAELGRAFGFQTPDVQAIRTLEESFQDIHVLHWLLSVGGDWTVPLVEISRNTGGETILVLGDLGRAGLAAQIQELVDRGNRVVAMDPLFIGELRRPVSEAQYALLLGSVGVWPLTAQAEQIAGVSGWLATRGLSPVKLSAFGPRTSLMALFAAAMDEQNIKDVRLHQPLGSFSDLISENLGTHDMPEAFPLGILEIMDVVEMAALVLPRDLVLVEPRGSWLRYEEELSRCCEPLGSADCLKQAHDGEEEQEASWPQSM